ncbi:hypothetical protein PPL_10426 [Heterostelium album PN500]|uniref:EGF-like domain-containing protein n=1 Tax=Heterostelium pallidum (strain ATCC 26659 / Pp 5 / PN500) TaxID=670386 RepID=D3BR23_HETP5|nr:hypothetical protein PPL_10426 [Heterostelium album PN500]EFA75855.1 hypothetical protein PPL_10426 [Heterostelium album PN500]|eukprot:XP_020427989.1 hypothetical protein PPL_10426 [Heterostelium album PN500]
MKKLIYLFLLYNIIVIKGEIDSDELSSLRWVAQFYQIGWNMTSSECDFITNGLGSLICLRSGNDETITKIVLPNNFTVTNQGIPSFINQLYFPNLTTFDARTIGNNSNINTDFDILYLIDTPSNVKLQSLQITNYIGMISPDFPVYLKLSTLKLSDFIIPNIPLSVFKADFVSIQFKNNLCELKISNTIYPTRSLQATKFPDERWISTDGDLTFFILNNNNMTGQIPEYSNLTPNRIDFENNPSITGKIPDSFCTANLLSFRNTSITTLPDCIYCLKGNLPSYIQLPPKVVKTKPGVDCEPQLFSKFFMLGYSNSTCILKGKLLGYRAPGDFSPSTLQVINPNILFSYKPTVPTGQTTLYFSTSRNIVFNISWVSDMTYISQTSVTSYNLTNFKLELFGQFNQSFPNHTITIINNGVCDINYFNSTYMICTATLLHPLIANIFNVSLRSYLFNNPFLAKTTSFPLVSSYMGKLMISGIVGGPINATYWDCQIGMISSGLLDVKIILNNFEFVMPRLFVEAIDIPNDFGFNDRCNENGRCINTKCICSTGFYGSYCELKIFDGGHINLNQTTPVTSIIANGYDFNFNMVGVQELDPSGIIVNELITSEWTTFNYSLDDVTYLRYSIQTDSKVNILALIQHSNKSRDLTFANQQFTIPPNGLKLSVDINGWVYSSNLNTLRVVFNTKIEEEDNYGCDSKSPIATGTLDDSVKYFKIIKNGLAFYGKFLPFSLSDGRSTYSRNEVINSTQDGVTYIGIHLPQCQTCSIDPDFSLLIQTENKDCSISGKSSRTWVIITIAVVCGVVGIAILSVATIFIIKNKRNIKLKLGIQMNTIA